MLPAVQRFLSGGDPYALGPWSFFVNPPWLLPLLVPFSILGQYGGYAMSALSLSGVVVLCVKRVKPLWKACLVSIIVASSVPFLTLLSIGNVDGFAIWGLVIGGPVGFFLLSVKPQVASLVGLVWIWQEYKRGGWIKVCKLASPTLLIALIFTALYPQWINAILSAPAKQSVSVNLWPWLILPGIYLLWKSLRSNKPAGAGAATGMISPYLGLYSTTAALSLVAIENSWLGLALSLMSWVYLFVRH